MIRVLVVDDDALVRTLLTSILGAQDIAVVGHATDGDEVVAAVQAHHPDVVLMDLHMPRMPGLDAIAALGALPQPPGVIALTSFGTDDTVLAAVRAGASGSFSFARRSMAGPAARPPQWARFAVSRVAAAEIYRGPVSIKN